MQIAIEYHSKAENFLLCYMTDSAHIGQMIVKCYVRVGDRLELPSSANNAILSIALDSSLFT